MKPVNIVEHWVDPEWTNEETGRVYKEHSWNITWRPIYQWTFDQYGSKGDAWNSEGTITLWESDDYNYRLIIETYKDTFELYTYVDQWGTYYFGKKDNHFYIASEEGTRSFWIAYLEALKMFADKAEFKMKEPTRTDWTEDLTESGPPTIIERELD